MRVWSDRMRAAIAVAGGGSNSVVLAAWSLDPPAGAVTTWEDALAALAAMPRGAKKELVLWADPDADTVQFPGGNIDLNGANVRGQVRDSDTDSDFRGWQELLLVTGSGDAANPTRLLNWGSFIDCWVRTSSSGGVQLERQRPDDRLGQWQPRHRGDR